jgi:hypothetical protein
MVPLIGQPGGPQSLPEMDLRILVAFIEGILRESDENAEAIDKMYAADSTGAHATAAPTGSRASEIEKFLALAAE